MERLGFGAGSKYDALEASHHLARYRFVKELCPGKRVLDAACGEGYGSRLMALWGASYVEGVDISAEAIESATRNFAAENIKFTVGDCEKLEEVVSPEKFDLVVSFETLEHVNDVHAYLESLKLSCKSDGSIVISCPNDHWVYKLGGSNEFHRRRLTFDEFKDLTTGVLGPAKSWHKSTLAIGYSINSEDLDLPEGGETSPQDLMFDYRQIDAGLFVPTQTESSATDDELAFYVGVWGPNPVVPSLFSGYPVSMELSRHALFPAEGVWAVKPNPEVVAWGAAQEARKEAESEETKAELKEARAELVGTSAELAGAKAELAGATVELERVTAEIESARTEVDMLKNQYEDLEAKYQSTKQELMSIQVGYEDYKAEVKLARAALENAGIELNSLNSSFGETKKDLALFTAEAEQLRTDLKQKGIDIESATLRARVFATEAELLLRGVNHRDWVISNLTRERDLLSQERDALSQERDVATNAIRGVPWRVVGIWRKVRKVVPAPLLRGVGKIWKIR